MNYIDTKMHGTTIKIIKIRICILEVLVSNLRQATKAFVVPINLPMLNLLGQIEIVHDCLLLNN